MCGIVGLLVKNPALRNQLGALMVPMLVGMTERGPDSAGLAVYTTPVSERHHKLSLYSGENAVDWSELLARIAADFAHAHEITVQGNHAVLISAADPDLLASMVEFGKPPRAVLRIDVQEAYFHCGKALMRSKLWSPETRVERAVMPSISQVIHEQTSLGEPEEQAVVEARYKTQL